MSDALSLDAVQLPRDEAGPVFDKPWQAQAFALTVQLYKSGHFTWPEWVEVFSREIKASPATPEESVNDAYYRQWMAALETITAARQLVAPTDVPARAEEWRQAYLNTPHGQPILLANAVCRPADSHGHHHHQDDEEDHHHHHHHGHKPQPRPVAIVPAMSRSA